jgi:hypothetical protein
MKEIYIITKVLNEIQSNIPNRGDCFKREKNEGLQMSCKFSLSNTGNYSINSNLFSSVMGFV